MIGKSPILPGMTDATPEEIALLIHYMPQIVRSPGLCNWDRKFCISACRSIKRGPWIPSDRQIAVMRRLHTEFLAKMRTISNPKEATP